jgi:hypothetical protein
MMITPKRLYFGLMGIIVLLIVGLLVGALGINSLLGKRADTLVGLKAKSQALTQEQLSLAGAKKSVQQYSSLEQIAQSIVPEDKDQAEAAREIVNIAAANNVSLASITFPASTLGTSTTGTTGATGSGATATKPTIVDLNAPSIALSQLVAVPNIPGVYQLSISVAGDPNQPVSYISLINFLSALEHNRRTAQISNITIAPNTTNPNLLTFSLQLNEYIKPQ